MSTSGTLSASGVASTTETPDAPVGVPSLGTFADGAQRVRVETTDGRVFVGFVAFHDEGLGTYKILSGKRGRPPVLRNEDVAGVEPSAGDGEA